MLEWSEIRYPAPLHPGDTIGVTAPSEGVAAKVHARLDMCIQHLKDLGFCVIEGRCLRQSEKHASASREDRVRDLLALWQMDEVKAIFPPWGGEILVHLLPLIDFRQIAQGPGKWILGYSDTSTLLFALTTLTGVATAHGTTLMEMIPDQSGTLSQQWRDVLSLKRGGEITLGSSSHYHSKGADWREDPCTTFNLTEKTHWRCMREGRELEAVTVEGRLIGGCLETLASLVGTPYGDLPVFRRRFAHEGLVLYLENAGSNAGAVCRMLWNMRLAGWFDDLNGLLLGRSGGKDTKQFSYLDALHDVLDDLPVPVVYDADIGHRPPQMTLVNGCLVTVRCRNAEGSVTLRLS